jgi:hypothetical protein
LFAAHADILSQSPFFAAAINGQFMEAHSKSIMLPTAQPEIFSRVLEYLYKGDYYPRLLHNKRRNSWELETASQPQKPGAACQSPADDDSATTHYPGPPTFSDGGELGGDDGAIEAGPLLTDTLVYCLAEQYDLPALKRLALRKQGLRAGVEVATIIRSARYAYANTPDSDARLRGHYLALIIRCRRVFKRSGTMQMEMERGAGGGLWFDLFVAMCNHLDDVADASNRKSPRLI